MDASTTRVLANMTLVGGEKKSSSGESDKHKKKHKKPKKHKKHKKHKKSSKRHSDDDSDSDSDSASDKSSDSEEDNSFVVKYSLKNHSMTYGAKSFLATVKRGKYRKKIAIVIEPYTTFEFGGMMARKYSGLVVSVTHTIDNPMHHHIPHKYQILLLDAKYAYDRSRTQHTFERRSVDQYSAELLYIFQKNNINVIDPNSAAIDSIMLDDALSSSIISYSPPIGYKRTGVLRFADIDSGLSIVDPSLYRTLRYEDSYHREYQYGRCYYGTTYAHILTTDVMFNKVEVNAFLDAIYYVKMNPLPGIVDEANRIIRLGVRSGMRYRVVRTMNDCSDSDDSSPPRSSPPPRSVPPRSSPPRSSPPRSSPPRSSPPTAVSDFVQCVICLENIDPYNPKDVVLSCGHIFHRDCIQQLCRLSEDKICPICRVDCSNICKRYGV
jgi:hypothetical protein